MIDENNPTIRKKKTDYVNNKALFDALVVYKNNLQQAKDEERPLPQIPNYIGVCIQQLCTRMANRPNFNGYSWKDEMITDAIITCVRAVDNFNPDEVKKNPFGYFSMIAFNAMVQRIKIEKKQNYIKHKNMEQLMVSSGENYAFTDAHDHVVGEYEDKM